MINNDTIQNLYNSFATEPALFEDRGLTALMNLAFDTDAVDFDGDRLVFNGIEENSPLRSVEIERIYGAADVDGYMAVVLHAAIIFINKADNSARIHIKEMAAA